MTKAIGAGIALATAVTLFGCSTGSSREAPVGRTTSPIPSTTRATIAESGEDGGVQDAVLYTIGLSTDPYSESSPRGFGVVTGLSGPRKQPVDVRSRDLGWFGGAEWLPSGRILVPRRAPPFRPYLLYRFHDRRVERVGRSPVPALHTDQAWSPDGALIASEPIVACRPGQRTLGTCWRQSGDVFVEKADGSERRKVWSGHFNAWTPDGRLLVMDRNYNRPHYRALDVATGEESVPISAERVAARAGVREVRLGSPRWSADGEYIAALAAIRWPRARTSSALVVARPDGSPLRFITSPYVISMFAWSPTGHRLAYTTSGFPDPHELFLVERPTEEARRLFATARHFDWITWSPDARWLLLDDEHEALWWLLPSTGKPTFRALPRMGGRPLWCCPLNAYATLDD
jgi:hypothetical protein